jgi:carbonic anhydrase
MTSLICYLATASVILTVTAAADDWEYEGVNGPTNWTLINPSWPCNNNSQSPINIQTNETQLNTSLTPVEFNYGRNDSNFSLINNGHYVQFTSIVGELSIKGAGLSGDYILEQFHFHWGPNNSEGSEHLLNGKAFSMELHLVHRKSEFANVSEALKEAGGVAVIGVFVEVVDEMEPNPIFSDLIDNFDRVPFEGNVTVLSISNISRLLPTSSKYYRYQGSLTTPPCTEGVAWFVYDESVKINNAQIEAFRSLRGDNNNDFLIESFRAVQPLNGRTVYESA